VPLNEQIIDRCAADFVVGLLSLSLLSMLLLLMLTLAVINRVDNIRQERRKAVVEDSTAQASPEFPAWIDINKGQQRRWPAPFVLPLVRGG
jgi:hypothetical protein